MAIYRVFTDGGARGNPGPAGAGVVIESAQGTVVAELAKPLGIATNNQAEYWGVIFALEKIHELSEEQSGPIPIEVRCFLDSELVAEQLAGRYKVKNEGLRTLHGRARELILALGGRVTFTHIPRHENTRADELSNRAMDLVESQRS